MPMLTAKELRELDAWIAEYVMSWKRVRFLSSHRPGTFMVSRTTGELMIYDLKGGSFSPTTNPADAFEVLKKCITKCNEDGASLDLDLSEQNKTLINKMHYGVSYESSLDEESETLQLAICLFAKKLFTK